MRAKKNMSSCKRLLALTAFRAERWISGRFSSSEGFTSKGILAFRQWQQCGSVWMQILLAFTAYYEHFVRTESSQPEAERYEVAFVRAELKETSVRLSAFERKVRI